MKRYVAQLKGDLINARENVYELKNHYEILNTLAPPQDESEFLQPTKTKTLSQIIGFDKILFPPPERLSKNQTEHLFYELNELIEMHNFYLDFPQLVDVKLKYSLVLSVLNEEFEVHTEEFIIIEFCDYDLSTCPFGAEHCLCKEYDD